MAKHKVEEITLSINGNSLENAFSRIAVAMFDIVLETKEINPVITKTLIIKSGDLKNLLYQFLKKLFDLANTELFVLAKVRQLVIEQISGDYLLNAVLIGDRMNEKYKIRDIVKQVTERNISVKENMEGSFLQINIVVERRDVENEV